MLKIQLKSKVKILINWKCETKSPLDLSSTWLDIIDLWKPHSCFTLLPVYWIPGPRLQYTSMMAVYWSLELQDHYYPPSNLKIRHITDQGGEILTLAKVLKSTTIRYPAIHSLMIRKNFLGHLWTLFKQSSDNLVGMLYSVYQGK